MKRGSISSSESKRCVLCGKNTSNFIYCEQSGLELRIPLCETKERDCVKKMDYNLIEGDIEFALRFVKREIIKQQ